MVYFQTKNPNLGKFCRVLQWKMLVNLIDIWHILRTFGIFYGHLVYFVVIWCSFSRFGMLKEEESGNPGYRSTFLGEYRFLLTLLLNKCLTKFTPLHKFIISLKFGFDKKVSQKLKSSILEIEPV
jgi:hypothetical protein